MSDRNWGLIGSGEKFEALVTTLVYFEDAGAALFGRRGPDGGQDVRSSDNTLVYQAKFNAAGSASKAIYAAKSEAKKIEKYRELGDPRERQWKSVNRWCLVTNAEFNNTDKEKWDDEIVPLYKNLGLEVEYWERAALKALLDKHPEVDRSFFQNETRVFLSVPEIKAELLEREPFLKREAFGRFVGREAEFNKVHSFLKSEHRFLVVYGAGGVGKTRFVLEVGEQWASQGNWQVLWANVASMRASGEWFKAIVSERPTILLVDDPEDVQTLTTLAEQMGVKSGRAPQWKVICTVRSSVNPVLEFFRTSKIAPLVAEPLEISSLSREDAEAMCKELIEKGPLGERSTEWRSLAVKELAKRFSNYPVWLTLAVHELEKAGSLESFPKTAEGLATEYLFEVVEGQKGYEPKSIRVLLDWIALVGTLDRSDKEFVRYISERAKMENVDAGYRALKSLVDRRALIKRGSGNRLVEIKPDVFRDHLLRTWLTVDIGFGTEPVQSSEHAKELIEETLVGTFSGTISSTRRAILESMARTEYSYLLSDQKVPLFTAYTDKVLNRINQFSVSDRVAIARDFVGVAAYFPSEIVKVSRRLRSGVDAFETAEKGLNCFELQFDDLLVELSWVVYHAAFGAKSEQEKRQILRELCDLAEAECEVAQPGIRRRSTVGRDAANLIKRTLEDGLQFRSGFEDVTRVLAIQRLDEISGRAPSLGESAVLKALVGTALSVSWEQIKSDGLRGSIGKIVILPGHPAWSVREKLKSKMVELLECQETPLETRLLLWSLFVASHKDLAQCRGKGTEEIQAVILMEIGADLRWARSVLESRVQNLDEMLAVRELWSRHENSEFEHDIKGEVERLKSLYLSNEIVAEFEALLNRDDWGTPTTLFRDRAAILALTGQEGIDAFLERAAQFFRGHDCNEPALFYVAWELGTIAENTEGVREFVEDALGGEGVDSRSEFSTTIALSWVTSRRSIKPEGVCDLVIELIAKCGSDELKCHFLNRLYSQLQRPKYLGDLSDEEFRFIRSQKRLFIDGGRGVDFIGCIAWGVEFEWDVLKNLVEDVLNELQEEELNKALDSIVMALSYHLQASPSEMILIVSGAWVLEQIIRAPDLDRLGGSISWNINKILELVGKLPLSWLPGALQRRYEKAFEQGYRPFNVYGSQMRLSHFVSGISEDGEIDPSDEEAVLSLLELVGTMMDDVSYFHELFQRIDPYGRVVPRELAGEINNTSDQRLIRKLARIAGGFGMNTEGWRIIARSVLRHVERANVDDPVSLYVGLIRDRSGSWMSLDEEGLKVFKERADAVGRYCNNESEALFEPFWEWYVGVMDDALKGHEGWVKEPRGE